MKMQINFTKDEKIDFLLLRGYVLCQRQDEVADNIYQNVFVSSVVVSETVWKDGQEYELRAAFEQELKTALIHRLL